MELIKSVLRNGITYNSALRKIYYHFLASVTLTEWYVKEEAVDLIGKGRNGFYLLDAGCGFGQYSYYFAKRFPNITITAVDNDPIRIEGLRRFFQRNGLKAHCFRSDLSSLNPRDRFDFILCTDVLEHISQDKEVIGIFYRALKRNGRLLLAVPRSPQRRILNFLERGCYGMAPERLGHVREGYTTEAITALVAGEGFKIEKRIYSFGILGSLAYEVFYIIQSRPALFVIFSPLYFFLIHPVLLILMYLDKLKHHRIGNGIIVVAKKD